MVSTFSDVQRKGHDPLCQISTIALRYPKLSKLRIVEKCKTRANMGSKLTERVVASSHDVSEVCDDSHGTRERILNAALKEFADKGLSGARVDRIAAMVQTSKRMIYYHFSGKDSLYQAVLARAYEGIRKRELGVHSDLMSPEEALRTIVGTSFDYHSAHPAFVRLVMNENIHRGKHMDVSTRTINKTIIDSLKGILERGQKIGIFRKGIDPKQLHLTISALGFHFVANQHTFSRAFDFDMTSDTAVMERRRITIETVLRWVKCRTELEDSLVGEMHASVTVPKKRIAKRGTKQKNTAP